MINLLQYAGKETITLELSGNTLIKGSIIDLSRDIVVLFNGIDFLYIPVEHIQHVTKASNENEAVVEPSELPSINKNELTLPGILTQALGFYTELYVMRNESLHGYITHVLQDYFVFHSPIYKTMYIASKHLKSLIPYPHNQLPYGLHRDNAAPSDLEPTLAAQLAKMTNELVILNQSTKPYHIGKIMKMDGPFIEMQSARMANTYVNLEHVKIVRRV
ncbi:DUF2642 domain-containing protein [Solibacillus sp. FSL H8-0538]|uniref:DUF2642 domain-containing protein n=1 Tax=Solibacillus sp. FSL H8-0538 TaxID=2921400 RepID=UPI0030FD07C2